MADRVEVLPGPGTAIRFGGVVGWAGPAASRQLLTFLLRSVQNVGTSSRGGRQIVDHIDGILSTRDPEPAAPFAVLGPADGGWVVLLHGPVQLWDGIRWLAPSPTPGWLQSPVAPQPAVSVGPAGAPAPRLALDSPYDLGTGMVPGGGVILVPGGDPTSGPGGNPALSLPAAAPVGVAGAPTIAAGGVGGEDDATGVNPPTSSMPVASRTGALAAPAGAAPVTSGRAARHLLDAGPVVDLRAVPGGGGQPLPPLHAAPAESGPGPSGPGPEVDAIRCAGGHVNHPHARACALCGAPLDGRPLVRAQRPPLGVLIADDGSVYRLAHDLVVGADPSGDPSVTAGRAGALKMRGRLDTLAPAHAEIRLSGWSAAVLDRGSAAGTFVVRPGAKNWFRLQPFQPEPLLSGAHVSLGQRILTFVGPWPAGD